MAHPEAWIVNPCVEVEAAAADVDGGALRLRVPSRRRGLQRLAIGADDPLYRVLTRLIIKREPLAALSLDSALAEQLKAAGVLLRAAHLPKPVRYHCPSSPERWEGYERVPAPPWAEDAAWLERAPRPAWFRDRRTGVRSPWWDEGGDSTRPPQAEPAALPSAAAAVFDERGWTRLPALIATPQVIAAERYFSALAREGGLEVDLRMARLLLRDEPVARYWLRELTPLVSRVVRRSLLAAEALYLSYRSGARVVAGGASSRGWTLLWMLAADPRGGAEPWPMSVVRRADAAREELRVAPGDGLLFDDARYTFERERLEGGRTVSLLELHWGAADPRPEEGA